jgi:hypothetical protein
MRMGLREIELFIAIGDAHARIFDEARLVLDKPDGFEHG